MDLLGRGSGNTAKTAALQSATNKKLKMEFLLRTASSLVL